MRWGEPGGLERIRFVFLAVVLGQGFLLGDDANGADLALYLSVALVAAGLGDAGVAGALPAVVEALGIAAGVTPPEDPGRELVYGGVGPLLGFPPGGGGDGRTTADVDERPEAGLGSQSGFECPKIG